MKPLLAWLFTLVLLATPASAQRVVRDLADHWKFVRDSVAPNATTSGWEAVSIPHSWGPFESPDIAPAEGAPPGTRPASYYRGVGWYARSIDLPAEWQGRRVFIVFEAVSQQAVVYLNGHRLGEHRGAFTAFAFELTSHLHFPGPNELRVQVDNSLVKTIAPLAGDFDVYGGIYRPVHLVATDPVCITPLEAASPGVFLDVRRMGADVATVEVKTLLASSLASAETVKVGIEIRDSEGRAAARAESPVAVPAGASAHPVVQSLIVPKPRLWQGRRDPYLYHVVVEVKRSGVVVDDVTQPLGIRTVALTADGFALNGQPYRVYGVNRHQEKKGQAWALSFADEENDLRCILELGATAVRLAHYPQSVHLHDIADRMGLLLWNEVSFVNNVPDAKESPDAPSETTQAFNANLETQLREMILQHYNHPSAAWWGLFNELRPGATNLIAAPEVKRLNELAHQLDASRPTVGASDHIGNPANAVPDAMGYNVYPGWYTGVGAVGELDKLIDERFGDRRQQRVALSEYGAGANPAQHQEGELTKPKANGGPTHPEEWQALMHERMWQQIRDNPKLWGSFVWVMYDFSSHGRGEGGTRNLNDKGLVTQDRKITKDAYHFYRANWTDEPLAYIASRRATTRRLGKTEVKAYTTASDLELLVNGQSLGTQKPDSFHLVRWPAVTLTPGRNVILVRGAARGVPVHDTCEWNYVPEPANVGSNAPTASAPPGEARLPPTLTPKAAAMPRINGPKVFGVRPDAPFLFSIPATGSRPMQFAVDRLPEGLSVDAATGRITGTVSRPGEYLVNVRATNALGSTQRPFRIVVGEEIALTPPLGWNSYNCFGVNITQDKMLRAARAMIALGLEQHGWTYVNMDDGWEARQRGGPHHALQADPERFTNVAEMVRTIHDLGLKAGLYSTPWTITYGGRLGGTSENADGAWPENADFKAKKNARQLPFAVGPHRFTYVDARQFAEWGFDYLKYDWGPVEAPEAKEMHQALRVTGRDIVLSLSNNHVKNLWSVVAEVSPWAQAWRTTTDISDNWNRVANDIGFAQEKWTSYGRPGHFNDADMLVVGHVGGWRNETRPSRLTPDEQYTHLSLWCLLSSPLLIGCDLEKMDAFTLGLLTNDEVLEIDQDSLCRPAVQVAGEGDRKVYAKPLDDGSLAVGLFNTGANTTNVTVKWSDLKLDGPRRVRDLWRQQDLGVISEKLETAVASHGVVLVRLFPGVDVQPTAIHGLPSPVHNSLAMSVPTGP